MSKPEIKVGQRWKRRDETVDKIIDINEEERPTFPVIGVRDCYTATGKFWACGSPHQWDLVELIEDAPSVTDAFRAASDIEAETGIQAASVAEQQAEQLQRSIEFHEGAKYLRLIRPAVAGEKPFEIDVYCVLEAFGVTCPARAHAIKKLLLAGMRGKGDVEADLIGVLAATNRAIELHRQREASK